MVWLIEEFAKNLPRNFVTVVPKFLGTGLATPAGAGVTASPFDSGRKASLYSRTPIQKIPVIQGFFVFVSSPGIEPGSPASQASILSIKLRRQICLLIPYLVEYPIPFGDFGAG